MQTGIQENILQQPLTSICICDFMCTHMKDAKILDRSIPSRQFKRLGRQTKCHMPGTVNTCKILKSWEGDSEKPNCREMAKHVERTGKLHRDFFESHQCQGEVFSDTLFLQAIPALIRNTSNIPPISDPNQLYWFTKWDFGTIITLICHKFPLRGECTLLNKHMYPQKFKRTRESWHIYIFLLFASRSYQLIMLRKELQLGTSEGLQDGESLDAKRTEGTFLFICGESRNLRSELITHHRVDLGATEKHLEKQIK